MLEKEKGQYLAPILSRMPLEVICFSAIYYIYHSSIFPFCSKLVILNTEDCIISHRILLLTRKMLL